MIELHMKRQNTTKSSAHIEEDRGKLRSLLETKSKCQSVKIEEKKFKRSLLRRLRPRKSKSLMKNRSGTNVKKGKTLMKNFPEAGNGFFCLLRGFLTLEGERRKLTTPQICEYVREWQLQNQRKLRKLGGAYSWIDRVENWSSVTSHALHFLTAEHVPENVVHKSSRRLICPRPYVDLKPRIHQWRWLLCPPSGANAKLEREWTNKFETETKELSGLFTDWLRAPRGLGGLTDAILSTSNSSLVTGKRKKRRTNVKCENKSKQCSQESDSSSHKSNEVDSELDEDQTCLQIDDGQIESDEVEKKSKNKQEVKTKVSKSSQQPTPNEDDDIPPPLFPTSWKLRPFTKEEKAKFQLQELERFSQPWTPFVYQIQDYYATVGPLRSAPSALNQDLGSLNSGRNWSGHSKARDHPLLKPDRPTYVSLAEIVRDAVACLPNGEGSRTDITTLVQNSIFLLPDIDPRKLQQCVSSALDRLQGEISDPSVYFNSSRRIWIYRHRCRSFDEFAQLHEARCAVNETKKIIQRGGDTTSVNSTNKVVRHTNIRNTEKLAEYSIKPNSVRNNTLKNSGRYQHSGGRHIQSGYVSRDYGYMEVGDDHSLNENDDYIPDIEELEAADEDNMIDYSCTSPVPSINSNGVGVCDIVTADYGSENDEDEAEEEEEEKEEVVVEEDEEAEAEEEEQEDDELDDDTIYKLYCENEIFSSWDISTDPEFTKKSNPLGSFQSRCPTSFIKQNFRK
ncbi:unnamed protein product [Trichobilharzia szidati]|nr:unnamed protein product [Trichobilharzia szidati]